ncbi:MAG: hypothetical protein GY808_01990, partial [Gammaproteobacteria bacterium]|nr:hypothetical protein [Gammaproteobacteria bacterium]
MKVVTLLILILFTSVLLFAADTEDRKKRRQATEKELITLQKKIKQLQQNQAKKRSSLTNEQKALKAIDVDIGQSRKTLEKTRIKLRKSTSRLKGLEKQQKQLDKNKIAQQKGLKNQIQAAHAGGKQEYLKLLFNQEDPGKVGRTLVYYEYLNKARMEKIQALTVTLEKLSQVEKDIRTEQQKLKSLEYKQNEANNRLSNLKVKQQQSIRQLNKSLKNNLKQLKEWQSNEEDLKSLLETLKHTVETLIPEESLSGLSGLRGKLNWPVRGRVREKFGSKRGNQ